MCGWIEYPLPPGQYRLEGGIWDAGAGCHWELRDFDTDAILQRGDLRASAGAGSTYVTYDFYVPPDAARDAMGMCPLSPRLAIYANMSGFSNDCYLQSWVLRRR